MSPRWRPMPSALAILFVILLTGCTSRTGDFGRIEPNRVGSLAYQSLGSNSNDPQGVSPFLLTDNEIEMRARAYRFFMPVHRQHFFTRGRRTVVMAWRWPEASYEIDVAAYYENLRDRNFASVPAFYGAIDSAIRSDRAMIERFLVAVRAVYRDDRRRVEALERVEDVTEEEASAAHARIAENRRVADWAYVALTWRAASYKYALDRAQIELPSREAHRVDMALAELVAAIEIFGRTLDLLSGGQSHTVQSGPMSIEPVSKF
ncbi:MAG: hypothetical protein AAFX39_01950 [Pseudomonadota bacterium]